MVDYNGLENRRTERYRGFESLSLRQSPVSRKIYRTFFIIFLAYPSKITFTTNSVVLYIFYIISYNPSATICLWHIHSLILYKKAMKKVLIVIGVLVLAGMILTGVVWWCSRTSNPWNAATIGDISAPVGYTRVDGSYAEFMRSLPLKKRGSKVQLYTGGDARFQFLSTGVIDIPMLSNSEQCADMTMRVRAEYLFSKGRYSEIRFQDVNGNTLQYQGGGFAQSAGEILEESLRSVQHFFCEP